MSDVMIETYSERTSTQESGCLPVRMTSTAKRGWTDESCLTTRSYESHRGMATRQPDGSSAMAQAAIKRVVGPADLAALAVHLMTNTARHD